jgi:1,4-dihydroxy-2-naphthoate octaprenyltransferase
MSSSANSSKKLWLAAIKPPMYSVAVIPIWVGTTAAFVQSRQINWAVFITFLLAAIAIIAWLNSSNDVFDSDTGIDVNKPHSLVNLTGNRSLIFWLSNLFLALGIFGIILICHWQRDWLVIKLILVCCFLGYAYQGPPFRLGYLGLGEIICFFTFGPLGCAAAQYAQNQSWSIAGLGAATIIGITTSIILFCSHFHQVKDDQAAGKLSPIVRMGTLRGARVVIWACLGVYGLLTALVLGRVLPATTLITWLSLPSAIELIKYVQAYHEQSDRISISKFIAVKLHFISGLLLGLGLIGAGML